MGDNEYAYAAKGADDVPPEVPEGWPPDWPYGPAEPPPYPPGWPDSYPASRSGSLGVGLALTGQRAHSGSLGVGLALTATGTPLAMIEGVGDIAIGLQLQSSRTQQWPELSPSATYSSLGTIGLNPLAADGVNVYVHSQTLETHKLDATTLAFVDSLADIGENNLAPWGETATHYYGGRVLADPNIDGSKYLQRTVKATMVQDAGFDAKVASVSAMTFSGTHAYALHSSIGFWSIVRVAIADGTTDYYYYITTSDRHAIYIHNDGTYVYAVDRYVHDHSDVEFHRFAADLTGKTTLAISSSDLRYLNSAMGDDAYTYLAGTEGNDMTVVKVDNSSMTVDAVLRLDNVQGGKGYFYGSALDRVMGATLVGPYLYILVRIHDYEGSNFNLDLYGLMQIATASMTLVKIWSIQDTFTTPYDMDSPDVANGNIYIAGRSDLAGTEDPPIGTICRFEVPFE